MLESDAFPPEPSRDFAGQRLCQSAGRRIADVLAAVDANGQRFEPIHTRQLSAHFFQYPLIELFARTQVESDWLKF